MTVGRRVRNDTGINKGAVSIGSAAVELATNLLGSLENKKILVMGAGKSVHWLLKPLHTDAKTQYSSLTEPTSEQLS